LGASPGEFAVGDLLIGMSQITVVNRHFKAVPACATARLFIVSDPDDFMPLDPCSLPQFGVKRIAKRQPLDGSKNQQFGLTLVV
jgi:hypothetical protein